MIDVMKFQEKMRGGMRRERERERVENCFRFINTMFKKYGKLTFHFCSVISDTD